MEAGRVYCEVKCSKNPSGIKSSEGREREAETRRTDVRGAREQTGKKEPTRSCQWEGDGARGSKGVRGCEKALWSEGGGAFLLLEFSRPAQLQNSGELRQKEREKNLALPPFNYLTVWLSQPISFLSDHAVMNHPSACPYCCWPITHTELPELNLNVLNCTKSGMCFCFFNQGCIT